MTFPEDERVMDCRGEGGEGEQSPPAPVETIPPTHLMRLETSLERREMGRFSQQVMNRKNVVFPKSTLERRTGWWPLDLVF